MSNEMKKLALLALEQRQTATGRPTVTVLLDAHEKSLEHLNAGLSDLEVALAGVLSPPGDSAMAERGRPDVPVSQIVERMLRQVEECEMLVRRMNTLHERLCL